MKTEIREAVLQRNQQITLSITDIGQEGQGIGRYEGMAVFVLGALPGETVEALVIKVDKKYAVGKLLTVTQASANRVTPTCPAFIQCGGCTLQHMNYEQQLFTKRQSVVAAMRRIGGIEKAEELVLPILGMGDPWHYRNKAAFPIAQKDGEIGIGFYAPRSHRLVALSDCAVQQEPIVAVMSTVRYWAQKNHLLAYDEEKRTGTLRHLVVRSNLQGELMVVIVTARGLPHADDLVEMLQKKVPGVKSIWQNKQPENNNMILGDEFILLAGQKRIDETLHEVAFSLSPGSFLQVNSKQAEVLYDQMLNYAQIQDTDTVVDAYCGIGTMSLIIAKKAKKVIGIESFAPAVADAKENASRNSIENSEFICALAEEYLREFADQGNTSDILVLDPPRKGCERQLLEAALTILPKRIIYVSCDPATLARDLKILLETGQYELKAVQPVDMFPQTMHAECVAALDRG